MLAWSDCVGPASLSENERSAAAGMRELGDLAVMELEHYVETCPVSGQHFLRPTILDDLKTAQQVGDLRRVLTLKLALQRFVKVSGPGATKAPG
jgi:hypothetical protein